LIPDAEDTITIRPPAAEFRTLEETAHLLRSPENARQRVRALQRALESGVAPTTLNRLKSEVGLDGDA